MLTSYLQNHPGLAFVDLRARAEGNEQQQPGTGATTWASVGTGATTWASVDVVEEGAARLSMTGAGSLPAGATVAEVTMQRFPFPDPSTTPRGRQVVVAPATPGAPSFAVTVEDGDEDEGGLWPLRAVFKGGRQETNVRAERVAEGEEECQVVYRLVALCDIADGAPLVLA